MIPEAPWARVFEAVIDTPNDVEKVRQLVLGRAMRGLLISQVESEGTGAEVLRRLAPLCTGQTAPNESGARWHEVPSSWEWSTLGMVGKIVGGGTPKTDNPEFFSSDGFPWLTPADLNGFRGKQITLGRKRISRAGLANSSAQLLPPGTVLFSSRAPIGYVAIAGCELTTNQGFKSVVPYLPEMAEFLYYYLKSAAVRIDREASGTTFKEVSGRIVSQIPVPLPPLAEQKRIVAKVDELMALCDRLEAQLQERDARSADLAKAALAKFSEEPTVENLKYLFHPAFSITPSDLRKGILSLAVRGKLVPQDSSDHPVDSMLTEIDRDKRRLGDTGALKADKRISLAAAAAPPHVVPDAWRWVRLQDVFEVSRGGSPRPAGDARFFGGPIPWITVGEVTKDSSRYLTSTQTGLTEEGAARSRFVNAGDLLLTNSGATLGVPKIAKIRGCINDGVAVLRQFHRFDCNDYAYLYLTQQTDAFRNVNQGMGQPNLNTSIIAGWPLPLPPLVEQRRIVAKVEELMVLVDQLEAQLAASEETGTKLLDALVAELAPSN